MLFSNLERDVHYDPLMSFYYYFVPIKYHTICCRHHHISYSSTYPEYFKINDRISTECEEIIELKSRALRDVETF